MTARRHNLQGLKGVFFVLKCQTPDNKHILTLRNVPDADALRDLSLHYPEGKAVVIGGGFVGIEVAEKVAQGAVVIDIRSKALHDGKALGLGTLFPCTIDTDNI